VTVGERGLGVAGRRGLLCVIVVSSLRSLAVCGISLRFLCSVGLLSWGKALICARQAGPHHTTRDSTSDHTRDHQYFQKFALPASRSFDR
jgi:hypothetical protein